MSNYQTGDVIDLAATLKPGSVDLIVSSPPFLAVRSYLPADHPDKAKEGGQQSTPGEYIDWLIDVVEALAPSLAPHGSLVFELGDTYAGGGGEAHGYDRKFRDPLDNRTGGLATYSDARGNPDGMRDPTFQGANTRNGGGTGWPRAKSKSLIPELFRIALTYGFNPLTGRQTERWILRNVITWARPNPTPGALGDKVRPATSDIACFTRSGKRWFDLDAERTPHKPHGGVVTWQGKHARNPDSNRDSMGTYQERSDGAPLLDWWELPPEQPPEPAKYPNKYGKADDPNKSLGSGSEFSERGNAPLLDYWVLPPGGYSGAHYAVWPPELVRRLINLMCPREVCRVCGEPRRRITERSEDYAQARAAIGDFNQRAPGQGASGSRSVLNAAAGRDVTCAENVTLGWSDCGHDDYRPGLVLDPFAGSGTTLAVADGMGRESIGFDLDDRNLTLARERCGMFLVEP